MEKEPLEHAIRCWQVEEENAKRIAGRKTLITGLPTGILAYMGVKVAGFQMLLSTALDATRPDSLRLISWFALLVLALAVTFLIISVAVAVEVQRHDPSQRGLASRGLHPLTRKEVLDLARASDPDAREIAYARTLEAARNLLKLNQRVEERLYDALGWLISGVGCSILALLAYSLVVAKSPVGSVP